jgi:two-component system response regulator AtoC
MLSASIYGKYQNTTFPAEATDCLVSTSLSYIQGISPEMQTIERLISEIARTDIPVLLVGETGAGKQMVALQIHGLSAYQELPFVKVTRGTFAERPCGVRLHSFADDNCTQEQKVGTFFFDEVSELDQLSQRRLLSFLPDGNTVHTNQALRSRIVSCTTRDLETEVQSGQFRSELLYRLSGVCLRLPPLRRRKEDIPRLVQSFLSKHARHYRRPEMSISEEGLQLLMEYPWPGNIRELENVVKKIVALGSEELGVADLRNRPAAIPVHHPIPISSSLKATSRAASHQAERKLILETLERTHWNRKRAAEALHISYKSLLYKLKQIQVPDVEQV